MLPGQPLQDLLAVGGQADPHHPAVLPVRSTLYQAGCLRAVHQFHRAVRAQQQVASQIAYGRGPVALMPLDRHQQLMLDMRQAGGLGLAFAPALEAPQGDPEFQQSLEVLLGELAHCHLPDPLVVNPAVTP